MKPNFTNDMQVQAHEAEASAARSDVIDTAFEVNAAMADIDDGDRGQFVRELFDGADVVWCVWRDSEPDLFHCEVIKGADRAGDVTCTAFLVRDSDFAEMMRAGLGDGAITPSHDMPAGVM